jgi:hypothetical protein
VISLSLFSIFDLVLVSFIRDFYCSFLSFLFLFWIQRENKRWLHRQQGPVLIMITWLSFSWLGIAVSFFFLSIYYPGFVGLEGRCFCFGVLIWNVMRWFKGVFFFLMVLSNGFLLFFWFRGGFKEYWPVWG